MGCTHEHPAPDLMLIKDVTDAVALEAAVRDAVRLCGAIFVEADMRAHRNPTRMAAIERATRDLVRRFHSRCPQCDQSGFRRDGADLWVAVRLVRRADTGDRGRSADLAVMRLSG